MSAVSVKQTYSCDSQEGASYRKKSWLARSRAWVSLLILLPIGIAVLLNKLPFQLESTAEILCTFVGYLLFGAGFAWRWWATLYIGGIKDTHLVQQGPYSMCRNPLYFGTFLLTLSIAFVMQSLTLGIAMILVSIYYLGVTVANEEARLEAWLGQEYRDYKARVPRFFPRFSLYHTDPVLTVTLCGLRAEALRTPQYACIPLLCHAIMHMRDNSWWPDFFNLP